MLMDQQHPITPPPELRRLWAQQARRMDPWDSVAWLEHVSTQAARWGADQELEACCAAEHAVYGKGKANWLRSLRRPKPPSLAEDALKALQDQIDTSFKISSEAQERADLIRAALERLKELEKGNE